MTIDPVDRSRHLWDGSEPGWKLCYVELIVWGITIQFASSGPSLREIAAMRKLLDEFRDKPASEVLDRLRGVREYQLDHSFDDTSSRHLVEKATQLSLNAKRQPYDRSGYLPIDPNGGTLLIERDDLSNQVVKNMLKAGVPVIEM